MSTRTAAQIQRRDAARVRLTTPGMRLVAAQIRAAQHADRWAARNARAGRI